MLDFRSNGSIHFSLRPMGGVYPELVEGLETLPALPRLRRARTTSGYRSSRVPTVGRRIEGIERQNRMMWAHYWGI